MNYEAAIVLLAGVYLLLMFVQFHAPLADKLIYPRLQYPNFYRLTQGEKTNVLNHERKSLSFFLKKDLEKINISLEDLNIIYNSITYFHFYSQFQKIMKSSDLKLRDKLQQTFKEKLNSKYPAYHSLIIEEKSLNQKNDSEQLVNEYMFEL